MPSAEVRERLAADVSAWQADGLIGPETAALLSERWRAEEFGLSGVIKYLGVIGGLFACAGVLGMIGAMARSQLFAAILVLTVAVVFFLWGLRLSLDPRGRYAASSKAVLAVGAVALGAGVATFAHVAGGSDDAVLVITGLVWVPLVIGLAYRFRNGFLLLLGLLGFFHWVGSWSAMMGRSTYATDVQDPVLMSAVSLLVIFAGILHERYLQARTQRFYLVYQALGLVYLNLSLLILSIGWHRTDAALWIAALTAAGLGQIVLGARLKSALFSGFGITMTLLNAYTRYYENFWDQLDAGLFFLAGGAILFGVGVGLERMLALRGETA